MYVQLLSSKQARQNLDYRSCLNLYMTAHLTKWQFRRETLKSSIYKYRSRSSFNVNEIGQHNTIDDKALYFHIARTL